VIPTPPEDGICLGDIVLTPCLGHGELKSLVVEHLKNEKLGVMFLDGKTTSVNEKDVKLIRPHTYLDSFTWQEANRAREILFEKINERPEDPGEMEVLLENYSLSIGKLNRENHTEHQLEKGIDVDKMVKQISCKPLSSYVERKLIKMRMHIYRFPHIVD